MRKLLFIFLFFSYLIQNSSAQGFELNKSTIKLKSKKGEIVKEHITLKNTSNTSSKWKLYFKGPDILFEKKDSVDWRKPENQDFISEHVALTRAHRRSFFNIKREQKHNPERSPIGTMWALGKTVDLHDTLYSPIRKAFKKPLKVVDTTISLRLNRENRYFDIVITYFGGKTNGGGFSYVRNEINPKWIKANQSNGIIAPKGTAKIEVTINSNQIDIGQHVVELIVEDDKGNYSKTPINISITAN